MTDRIAVDRIAVFAHHGLFAEEQKLGQRFYISLVAGVDTRAAGLSDDFTKTVSYVDLTEIAVANATRKRFHILEALAEAIAGEILESLPAVEWIRVKVEKPSAPIPAVLENVSVAIERSRR